MTLYAIREDGKTGRVEVLADRIIRTRKKLVGKDDVQVIDLVGMASGAEGVAITGHTDEVKLTVGSISYEWKVENAEEMLADLRARCSESRAAGARHPNRPAVPATGMRHTSLDPDERADVWCMTALAWRGMAGVNPPPFSPEDL
jgi:hypothetical protein